MVRVVLYRVARVAIGGDDGEAARRVRRWEAAPVVLMRAGGAAYSLAHLHGIVVALDK